MAERRFIDIRNLKLMSNGAFGSVYELSEKTVLKTITSNDVELMASQEFERTAKVRALGIPCAVALEIVDTEKGAALIYERFPNGSLARNLRAHPERLPEYIDYFSDLAIRLGSTVVPGDLLPDAKEISLTDADRIADFFGAETGERYKAFLRTLPDGDRFLHRDLHFGNVMPTGEGAALIDLPDAAKGHPIFELICTADIYHLFPQRNFFLDYQTTTRVTKAEAPVIWNGFCTRYFAGLPKEVAAERQWAAEQMACIHACVSSISRTPPEEYAAMREDLSVYLENGLLKNRKEITRILREWTL